VYYLCVCRHYGVRIRNRVFDSEFMCVLDIANQVCELDIIFNFEKAHFVLDEFILGGEVQESSQKTVLAAISQQDIMQEVRVKCRYLPNVLNAIVDYLQLNFLCPNDFNKTSKTVKQFIDVIKYWYLCKVIMVWVYYLSGELSCPDVIHSGEFV